LVLRDGFGEEHEELDGKIKTPNGYVEPSEYVKICCLIQKDCTNIEQVFFMCAQKNIENEAQYVPSDTMRGLLA
jgi:hypothetical protein